MEKIIRTANGRTIRLRPIWGGDKAKRQPKRQPEQIQVRNLMTGDVLTFANLDAYKQWAYGDMDI